MTHKRALLMLAAGALAIAWLGAGTNIDLRLARAMYDQASGAFPMRHAWLAETLSHAYMKNVMLLLAVCALLPAAVDCWRPRSWPNGFRLRLRVVALASLLVPLVTTLLKQASSSHCPWDLADFGGTHAYVRLLDAALSGAPAGHCMPAGHASGALWLVSLTVFWLPHQPRKAAAMACATLGFGFTVGWMQQLRGAHFLTHTLWSMWLACAIVYLLYAWLTQGWTLASLKRSLGVEPGNQIGDGAL
jgi:membrane-associated PAP2 superfamily phosphatase